MNLKALMAIGVGLVIGGYGLLVAYHAGKSAGLQLAVKEVKKVMKDFQKTEEKEES